MICRSKFNKMISKEKKKMTDIKIDLNQNRAIPCSWLGDIIL